jgi:alcohol dehydrogenase/S-(hydroxymethyl)glutathione dehydrogenase/alcohol dehydrogenase
VALVARDRTALDKALGELRAASVVPVRAMCNASRSAGPATRGTIDQDIPLEWAALVSCGVAIGWGSVVINAGQLKEGDTVVVYGFGGIGANAARAAVTGGAGLVAVVDPVEGKRQKAKEFGVDFVYASAEEAHSDLWERTHSVAAGVVESELVTVAFHLTRKGGTIALAGVTDVPADINIELPGSLLTLFSKKIVGILFGDCSPQADVPRLLRLAKAGKLKLDDLAITRYGLEDINQGFEDMLAGRNLRGVIVHEH